MGGLFSLEGLCALVGLCALGRGFCGAGGGRVSAQIDAWEEPESCDTKFPKPVDWTDVNGNSCNVYDYGDPNKSSVPMKYVADAAAASMTAVLLLVIPRAAA